MMAEMRKTDNANSRGTSSANNMGIFTIVDLLFNKETAPPGSLSDRRLLTAFEKSTQIPFRKGTFIVCKSIPGHFSIVVAMNSLFGRNFPKHLVNVHW